MYKGFNLIVGDGQRVFYATNVGSIFQKLESGTHAFSNSPLGYKLPKLDSLASFDKIILQMNRPQMVEQLLTLLSTSIPSTSENLMAACSGTICCKPSFLSDVGLCGPLGSFGQPNIFGTRASYAISMFQSGNEVSGVFAERIMETPTIACSSTGQSHLEASWLPTRFHTITPSSQQRPLQQAQPFPKFVVDAIPHNFMNTPSMLLQTEPLLPLPIQQNAQPNTKAKRKTSKRDPKRPKGYISAFNFFAKDMRAQILKEQPDLGGKGQSKNNAINLLVGTRWKQLPAESKRPYEDKAVQDKVRYLRELDAYQPSEGFLKAAPRVKAPPGHSWNGKRSHNTETHTGTLPTRKKCKHNQPKRPLTAYMYFLTMERKNIDGELLKQKSFAVLSKELGARWQAMDKEARKTYENLARVAKEDYSNRMMQLQLQEM
jgi:hypothetical protein